MFITLPRSDEDWMHDLTEQKQTLQSEPGTHQPTKYAI